MLIRHFQFMFHSTYDSGWNFFIFFVDNWTKFTSLLLNLLLPLGTRSPRQTAVISKHNFNLLSYQLSFKLCFLTDCLQPQSLLWMVSRRNPYRHHCSHYCRSNHTSPPHLPQSQASSYIQHLIVFVWMYIYIQAITTKNILRTKEFIISLVMRVCLKWAKLSLRWTKRQLLW